MSCSYQRFAPYSPSVTDRSLTPDLESIPSVFSASSGERDQDMAEFSSSDQGDVVPNDDIRKNERFYFRDNNIKLIVEKCLYNVPRTPLERHSPFFRDLFASPPDAHMPPGWSSQQLNVLDQHVLVYLHSATNVIQTVRPSISGPYTEAYPLYDTTPAEFDSFLSVLYPEDYARHDLTTATEWVSVLKLATVWSFTSIRELAIARLVPLLHDCHLQMLVLARQYHVEEWLNDALCALIEREEPLNFGEATKLQLEDVMHILNGHRTTEVDRSVAMLRADPLFTQAFEAKEAERKAASAAKRKAEAEREAVEREAKKEEDRKAEEEARLAKEKVEREEEDAARVVEKAREEAERVEAERKAEEVRIARGNADREAEEEQACLAAAKADEDLLAKEAEEAHVAMEKAEREAEAEHVRVTTEEADAEHLEEEKAEEERLAKERADREAEAARKRLEEVRGVDMRNAREAQLTRLKEIRARRAQEAEDATARRRALDKAARVTQQSSPSLFKPLSGSNVNLPLASSGSSSGRVSTATRQSAQTSAPSPQHAAFAGVPTARPPSLQAQKAASPPTSSRPSLWNRLSAVSASQLPPIASSQPQTPTSPAHQFPSRHRPPPVPTVTSPMPGNIFDPSPSEAGASESDGGPPSPRLLGADHVTIPSVSAGFSTISSNDTGGASVPETTATGEATSSELPTSKRPATRTTRMPY